MPTAPRLNLGHARGSADLAGDHQAAGGADLAEPVRESQGRLVQALRELMNATEDVGDRLADQVRAMHHGDLEQRNIRGRASPAVAQELLEEGIELLPLPALPPFKATLH